MRTPEEIASALANDTTTRATPNALVRAGMVEVLRAAQEQPYWKREDWMAAKLRELEGEDLPNPTPLSTGSSGGDEASTERKETP